MGQYYKTCPNCGANLDPGEHYDCEGEASAKCPDHETRPCHCKACGLSRI